jgi:LmbE family N-acetylglucosaminyl deacetylase
VLIIAPHQDDEMLGCGGFIRRYGSSLRIQVAFVTDGRGRRHRSEQSRLELAAERKREAREVCAAVGIEEPLFLDFEDGITLDHPTLAAALEKLLATVQPDVILAPFGTDCHPDHIATSRALGAVSQAALEGREILLYQVHSQIPDPYVNRYLGLTPREHSEKAAALRLYVTQDMGSDLTLAKYLLLGTMAPQGYKHAAASVEYFASLAPAQLRSLCEHLQHMDFTKIRSLTTSPYSFRVYLRNKWALDGIRP